MTPTWFKPYRAAVLETDWTKMQERLRSAELAIQERQHILSMDHGGSPKERQAIVDALRGLEHLRTEATEWQTRQVPQERPYQAEG